MADVSVDATIATGTARGGRSLVFPTADIGYAFYIDSDGVFGYSKTSDGGATWGAQVNVDGAGATTSVAFDVWFDKWTSGDSGTLIHTWWFDSTNDIVRWRTLDTSGDTLGTVRTVFTGASAVAGRGAFVSGTKTISGYLYCCYDIDAGAEKGLHRSTDAGVTWSTNLATTFLEATLDTVKLFPASGTGDNNDCWAIYYDASATALTIKMWDSSAVAQVESATFQTHTDGSTDLTGQFGYDGACRHSDGHLIVAAVSLRDNASSVHQVFDVTSTSTITTKTNITTNIDDHYYPQVFINQGTGTIFVSYVGKRDGTETLDTSAKVYYTYSTDGGTTWAAGDAAYQEGAAAAVQQIWSPHSGSRFYVTWRVTTTLNGNKVNSLIQVLSQGSTITSGSVVTEPTVAPGDVAVITDFIAVGSQIFEPTVAAEAEDQEATTEFVATTAQVFEPTVTSQTSGATIGAGSAVYEPTVVPGDVAVTGATLAVASVANEPTVTPGAVTVTTDTQASTSQVFEPSVVGERAVTTDTLAPTSQVFATTVTVGAVTVTGSTQASTQQLFAPVLTALAEGATIVGGSGVFAPTLAMAIIAGTVTVASQVHLPTVAPPIAQVTTATQASTSQVNVPTVSPGAVTITGATCPTTAQVFALTVVGAGSIATDTISSASQVFAPVVTPAPSAVTGFTVVSTAQLFIPTVDPGAVTVTAATIASTVQLIAPSLTTAEEIDVDGDTISATSEVFEPFVILHISGLTISSTAQLFAPTIEPEVGIIVVGGLGPDGQVFSPTIGNAPLTGGAESDSTTVRYLVRARSIRSRVLITSGAEDPLQVTPVVPGQLETPKRIVPGARTLVTADVVERKRR